MATVQWSKKYEKCKTCGTTQGKHRARGLCKTCFQAEEKIKNRERRKKNDTAARAAIASRPLEWTPERVQEEADALVEWSKDPKNLVIEKFGLYREPPYIREVMYKLGAQNEYFRSAFLIAKERLRSRREEGAYAGYYNASTFQFTHTFHDRQDIDKDVSFAVHKKEMKAACDDADVNKQKQAIVDAKKFIEEAKDRIAKRKKKK